MSRGSFYSRNDFCGSFYPLPLFSAYNFTPTKISLTVFIHDDFQGLFNFSDDFDYLIPQSFYYRDDFRGSFNPTMFSEDHFITVMFTKSRFTPAKFSKMAVLLPP